MLEGSDLMKRIVLCADGTWNVRDQVDKASNTRRPTNVTKVARAVRPRASNGTDQAVFYHEGVGTAGGLDRYTGGAFGEGIEANIRELYRFLVYNYEPGDELYFFGFRRGAFTVRTLAGLMNKVGLVQKDDDYYVPELYACYEGSKGPGSPEWIKTFHNIKVPRPCPPIRFIGVWDTVGALGAPGFLGQFLNKDKYKYKYKYKYHDVGLNPHIRERLSCPCHRRTAQALPAQDGLANEALHWIREGGASRPRVRCQLPPALHAVLQLAAPGFDDDHLQGAGAICPADRQATRGWRSVSQIDHRSQKSRGMQLSSRKSGVFYRKIADRLLQ